MNEPNISPPADCDNCAFSTIHLPAKADGLCINPESEMYHGHYTLNKLQPGDNCEHGEAR